MGVRSNKWQSLLSEVLEDAKHKPFIWGHHDCCLFPCDCVLAMTGIDPAASFRGEYHDEQTAYDKLIEYSGGGLEKTAEKIFAELNFEEVKPAFAQRGDVVLCENSDQQTLGIVDMCGRKVAAVSFNGLIRQPLLIVKRAWRVG